MQKNICVFGVGGVGGYIGGKIAKAFSEQQKEIGIFFIARGAHLEAIKKNGLLLNSEGTAIFVEPTLATDVPAELPEIEICFICVKSYDLANALDLIKPKLRKDSIVIAPLNGVDIYNRIRSVLNKSIILPSSIIVGTYIEKPGVVTQSGGGRLVIGEDPLNRDFNLLQLFNLLKTAGLDYVFPEDAGTEIWTKFIFIASFALVCSCYDKTLGQIMESDVPRKKVVDVMNEIAAIADKKGIVLDENIINISLDKAGNFPYETKTSLHRDIEDGKPNELDLFGGAIIEMGEAAGIATPATSYLSEQIKNKL